MQQVTATLAEQIRQEMDALHSVALDRVLRRVHEAQANAAETARQAAANPEAYISLGELAQELGIARRTLERMRELGTGPPVMRLGQRRLVVSRRAAEAWLVERQTKIEAANAVISSEQRTAR